ncbi:MAG: CehA/McbA family metallohydrolase [Verrucomicrobia bacterium]|nr:CehA/McbA family metallohydrolase [Verrucomicrobiota bacterium]
MRSLILSFLLAGWLAAIGLVPSARAAAPTNLITNGGFEEGTSGWETDAKHELVSDPKRAHSGKTCLSGEVTREKQALVLRKRVPVKAGCRYQFEIWVKATNKTKVVLRYAPPGEPPAKAKSGTSRLMAGAWDELPNRWQKYECDVPVTTSGTMELQIIAPSSHGAPPGRVWIDDIALYETELPATELVSANVGFNDEVTMAQASDGSVYVVWNSFRDNHDTMQIARYTVAGRTFKKLGQWQPLGAKDLYLLGFKAVPAGDKVFVLYAAEVNKQWNVYALPCGVEGPGKPVRISSSDMVDIKPAGAWRDGTLWVAWETNASGWREIVAASLRDGVVSKPERVSGGECSNYGPAVAVLPGGEVAVAWHSFRQNNYDLFLRRRKADGEWRAETRLTRAPTIDRHPLLLTRGNDLWLIYENALMGNRPGDEGIEQRLSYGIGATRTRRLVVTKVGDDGLLAPANYTTTSPVFRTHAEAPTAVFDSSGRLWLACRTLGAAQGKKAKSRSWNVTLTCFDGAMWTEPGLVSHRPGMDRWPAIAMAGERVVVAYQSEEQRIMYNSEEDSKSADSQVSLASVPTKPAVSMPAAEFVRLVEPKEPFAPGKIRVERGEDRPTRSISYNGQKLNLYFGDLHDHTDISQCNRCGDESVDESYANMRDIARHDFAAATDHGYNINPYHWNFLAKLARANEDSPRFLTFLAEEWTSSFEEYSDKHPYGFYGHRNLIFADPYFPRWWNARTRYTPAQVWEELRKMKANFVHIPHQIADTGNVPTDWNFTDEVAQPVAEIFQCRGSYEYKGAPREAERTTPQGYFIQDAWKRGIVIGSIASPDHAGGYGKACVYAPELSREAILDALRARRCYASTAAKIFLDVRVNGHLMGEKVEQPAGAKVSVEVKADCPAEIDRIEICRNNEFIHCKTGGGCQSQFTFTDGRPPAGFCFYYVRVMQKDGEIAWTSPVWFGTATR